MVICSNDCYRFLRLDWSFWSVYWPRCMSASALEAWSLLLRTPACLFYDYCTGSVLVCFCWVSNWALRQKCSHVSPGLAPCHRPWSTRIYCSHIISSMPLLYRTSDTLNHWFHTHTGHSGDPCVAWWSENIWSGGSSSLSRAPLDYSNSIGHLFTCNRCLCIFINLTPCEPDQEGRFSTLMCVSVLTPVLYISFIPKASCSLRNPIMLSCGLACWKGDAGSLTPGRDALSISVWSLPLYFELGQTPLDQIDDVAWGYLCLLHILHLVYIWCRQHYHLLLCQ